MPSSSIRGSIPLLVSDIEVLEPQVPTWYHSEVVQDNFQKRSHLNQHHCSSWIWHSAKINHSYDKPLYWYPTVYLAGDDSARHWILLVAWSFASQETCWWEKYRLCPKNPAGKNRYIHNESECDQTQSYVGIVKPAIDMRWVSSRECGGATVDWQSGLGKPI